MAVATSGGSTNWGTILNISEKCNPCNSRKLRYLGLSLLCLALLIDLFWRQTARSHPGIPRLANRTNTLGIAAGRAGDCPLEIGNKKMQG